MKEGNELLLAILLRLSKQVSGIKNITLGYSRSDPRVMGTLGPSVGYLAPITRVGYWFRLFS